MATASPWADVINNVKTSFGYSPSTPAARPTLPTQSIAPRPTLPAQASPVAQQAIARYPNPMPQQTIDPNGNRFGNRPQVAPGVEQGQEVRQDNAEGSNGIGHAYGHNRQDGQPPEIGGGSPPGLTGLMSGAIGGNGVAAQVLTNNPAMTSGLGVSGVQTPETDGMPGGVPANQAQPPKATPQPVVPAPSGLMAASGVAPNYGTSNPMVDDRLTKSRTVSGATTGWRG